MSVHTEPVAAGRLWWARTLLVLHRPAPVFEAIRDDSREQAEARQEPVLAIVLLAGIAGVLSTSFAAGLLDDRRLGALDFVVWTFLGGAAEGGALYFLLGALVYVGGTAAGSAWSYRQARHVLAFAAVPLAASIVLAAVRVAASGDDAFGVGGETAFEVLEVVLLAWAAALLVVGVRALHGWSWGRAAGAAALPLLVPALVLARAYGLV